MFANRHEESSHRLFEAVGVRSARVGPRKRILIVDDLPLTRRGLSLIIEAEPDLSVCGQAADAASTMAILREVRPDLVTVGLSLPDMSGVGLIRLIRAMHPEVPILVVSRYNDRITMEQAFEAGARGYVTKYDAGGALVEAVRRLLAGGTYVSGSVHGSRGGFRSGAQGREPARARC